MTEAIDGKEPLCDLENHINNVVSILKNPDVILDVQQRIDQGFTSDFILAHPKIYRDKNDRGLPYKLYDSAKTIFDLMMNSDESVDNYALLYNPKKKEEYPKKVKYLEKYEEVSKRDLDREKEQQDIQRRNDTFSESTTTKSLCLYIDEMTLKGGSLFLNDSHYKLVLSELGIVSKSNLMPYGIVKNIRDQIGWTKFLYDEFYATEKFREFFQNDWINNADRYYSRTLKKLQMFSPIINIAVDIAAPRLLQGLGYNFNGINYLEIRKEFVKRYLNNPNLPTLSYGSFVGQILKEVLEMNIGENEFVLPYDLLKFPGITEDLPPEHITNEGESYTASEGSKTLNEEFITFQDLEEIEITTEQKKMITRFFNSVAKTLTSILDNPEEIIEVMNTILGPLSMGFQVHPGIVSPIDYASFQYSKEQINTYILYVIGKAKKRFLMSQIYDRLNSGLVPQVESGSFKGLYRYMQHIQNQTEILPFEDFVLQDNEVINPKESIQEMDSINIHLSTLNQDKEEGTAALILIKASQQKLLRLGEYEAYTRDILPDNSE